MFIPVNQQRRGSALLITLLLMGVLTIFGLGLGTLLVREIRVQSEAMRAAQALYAAEGAVERGLLERTAHAVGYTVSADATREGTYDSGADYSYTITGVADTVPCSYELNRVSANTDGYQPLAAEQTVRMPLFYEDENGTIISETDWVLAYTASTTAEFRWKVFGLTDEGDTESMNDVVSVLGGSIATVSSMDSYGDYENTAAEDGVFSYTENSFSLQQFLTSHTYPYLVLTNLAPADGTSVPVYFQLKATADLPVTCEYARVAGESQVGTFGVQQNVDALIRIDTALPLFDFVLYQLTDTPLIPVIFAPLQTYSFTF